MRKLVPIPLNSDARAAKYASTNPSFYNPTVQFCLRVFLLAFEGWANYHDEAEIGPLFAYLAAFILSWTLVLGAAKGDRRIVQ